jgi:hypothetical protein
VVLVVVVVVVLATVVFAIVIGPVVTCRQFHWCCLFCIVVVGRVDSLLIDNFVGAEAITSEKVFIFRMRISREHDYLIYWIRSRLLR